MPKRMVVREGEADAHQRQAKLEKLFQRFDADSSGFISADEYRIALGEMESVLGDVSLSDEDVGKLLATADKNGDGRVDVTEATSLT